MSEFKEKRFITAEQLIREGAYELLHQRGKKLTDASKDSLKIFLRLNGSSEIVPNLFSRSFIWEQFKRSHRSISDVMLDIPIMGKQKPVTISVKTQDTPPKTPEDIQRSNKTVIIDGEAKTVREAERGKDYQFVIIPEENLILRGEIKIECTDLGAKYHIEGIDLNAAAKGPTPHFNARGETVSPYFILFLAGMLPDTSKYCDGYTHQEIDLYKRGFIVDPETHEAKNPFIEKEIDF